MFMLTEERIQYQGNFFLRKCSKYFRNFRVNHKSLGRAGSKCWLGKRPVIRVQHWLLAHQRLRPLLFFYKTKKSNDGQLASVLRLVPRSVILSSQERGKMAVIQYEKANTHSSDNRYLPLRPQCNNQGFFNLGRTTPKRL